MSFVWAWCLLFAAGASALGCGSDSREPAGAAGSSGTTGGSPASGGSAGGGAGGGAGTAGAAGTGGGTAGSGGTGMGAAAGAGGSAGSGGSTAGTGNAGGTAGSSAGASAFDVLVNPYATNPLSAIVNLHGVEATDVAGIEVSVSGQDGSPDFTKAYLPADPDLVQNIDASALDFSVAGYAVPVYGLYADRENTVRIRVDRNGQEALDFEVAIDAPLAKPDEDPWVPPIAIRASLPEKMEPGWTVVELSIEPNPSPPLVFVEWTRSIAFDERGAIRWALRFDDLPKGETFTLRRSIDGNFLTGSLDTLVEVSKLGRILRSSTLPDHTLHHEIIQIGSPDNGEGVSDGTASEHNGNLLVLASKNDAGTIQDRVVEVDAATGAVLSDWDFTEILDPTRKTFIDFEEWAPGVGDWLHANGLAYSAADESIIVSGRHQGVSKIRRDGSLVWLLAPHKGWNEPQLAKLLTAVDASGAPYEEAVQSGDEAAGDPAEPDFDWPFGQHSPALLPNGDLLLFDNGASRHFGSPYGSYSRAVIFRIDEANMTVRQVAQFVLTRPESAFFVSNTHRLPTTGNILIQPGGSYSTPAVVKELTTLVAEDGSVSFDELVFDAAVDLSWVDPRQWFVYSFRGHRWVF